MSTLNKKMVNLPTCPKSSHASWWTAPFNASTTPHSEVVLGSGWRCRAVAILVARSLVVAVRFFVADVVMRWLFWIVTWSFAAALLVQSLPPAVVECLRLIRQFLFFGALLEECWSREVVPQTGQFQADSNIIGSRPQGDDPKVTTSSRPRRCCQHPYRSHLLTTFLDPVLGAMMKQVCWHSALQAFRGLRHEDKAKTRIYTTLSLGSP